MFIFKESNILLEKITNVVNAYDPYGNLRVNTLQSMVMLSFLVMLNAIINLPQFNSILTIALFGVWSINSIVGYEARIKGLCIFSGVIIPYALLLGLVHNDTVTTILLTGLVIFFLFKLARNRFPQLLAMIPLIQILDYTMLKIPVARWGNLFHWAGVYLLACLLMIGFLIIFPRIYFFRIWLRAVYLAVEELENRLKFCEESPEFSIAQPTLKHLPRILEFTSMLSNKDYGFSARRIGLKVMSLSAASMALISKTTQLDTDDIDQLRILFEKLRYGMANTKPVENISSIKTTNGFCMQFYQDICYIIHVWNQLCLKL